MTARPHAFQAQPEQPSVRPDNPVRQIGWLGHSGEGRFYRLDEYALASSEPGGFSPVYVEAGD